jgi:hypothetical protein
MRAAIALVGVALLCSGAAHADDNAVQTAGGFLQRCRVNRDSCISYIQGAIDGTVWTEIFDHDPHPLCFPHAESYFEIAEAYVGYLAAMAANGNDPHEWLSKGNTFILEDFLHSRYGCAPGPTTR